ncbi:MAG: hypothetical protein FWC50_02590, partial [Planctomycetaceae bacterium]|nr:hypothetical protein [Planctomycetaceae bacterium]
PVENSGSWTWQVLQRRTFAQGRRLPPIPAAVYQGAGKQILHPDNCPLSPFKPCISRRNGD